MVARSPLFTDHRSLITKEADCGLFEVKGFALFSSVLTPEGAIHSVEMRQDF